MIAKVAKRKKQISSFQNLAQYITSQAKLSDGTNKVAQVRFTNCHALDADDAVLEIIATQEQNQTTKSNKTYHLIVSFPLGERPDEAVLHDIEEQLVVAVGLEAHQRLSAVHHDTSYLHIHIAVNKIHPETFGIADLKHDYRKLQETSRALERQHGLERLNAAPELTTEAAINDLSNAFNLVIRASGATWTDIHALLNERHLKIKPAGRGLVITDRSGRVAVKPSQLGREFSKMNLEKRLGKYQPTNATLTLSDKAETIERSAKIESFQSWTKETITDKLQTLITDKNADWQETHLLLAKEGLLIKPARRGFIITDQSGKFAIKPSQIGREFSRASMEKQLGEYQPASPDINVSDCQYNESPKQKSSSQRLWNDYTELKTTQKDKRKAEYSKYAKERDSRSENIKAEFAEARAVVWNDKLLSAAAKRRLAKELSLKRKAALAKLKANNALRRDQINARTLTPDWRDYLMQKAQTGDPDAIKALRNSKPKPKSKPKAAQGNKDKTTKKTSREALIAEYDALRDNVWADKLLSGKQKYRLNKYINARQKETLSIISGVGWTSHAKEKAEQDDTGNNLSNNVEFDTIDIAADAIANKKTNAQIKPNGDVSLGEEIIIRNNKIQILASTGYRKALDIAAELWQRITNKPTERDQEQHEKND